MAEPDLPDRAETEAALFGGRHLFAPIRHHSPACAWMLRAMIRETRPEVILIEAPSDLAHHIPMLTRPETVPPIAIASLGPLTEGVRDIRYMPFSATAPEWIAIREGHAIGAEIRFIDLPANTRTETGQVFAPETPFDSAAFIAATCAKLGLRDGTELWDHLFEARLGETDWRHFFGDVHAYCCALRASTAPEVLAADDTLPREATMRSHLAQTDGARSVVVTGGFHTPALIAGGATDVPAPGLKTESYLIAYGEDALDQLSGYAAGLRHPAWHARAFEAADARGGRPDWSALARETVLGFAAQMAEGTRRIALPQLVETLAMAEGVARLRGHDAILLADLFDGARSALVKGLAGPGDAYAQALDAHLRGTALGTVPVDADRPPIVADARDRAARARIDLTDSTRKSRKLDIRRKPGHRAASQFLHQMDLLDTELGARNAGPDFVSGTRADLLFEDWDIAWSPFVEGRLIDAARLGASVPEAAANRLRADRQALFEQGRGDQIAPLLDLVLVGLRAGLGPALAPLTQDLRDTVTRSGDLAGLAEMIRRLQSAAAPGDPLHDPNAPDLLALARAAFDRAVYLLPDLTQVPEEDLGGPIAGLRLLAGVLRGPDSGRFDGDRFNTTLVDLADAPTCPPRLAGAVTGVLVRAGLRDEGALANVLRGKLLAIGAAPTDRAAAMDGLMATAPLLLWQSAPVLEAANSIVTDLPEDAFLALLPALRRSLTALNPHETDRLAQELARLLGTGVGTLTTQHAASETDLARGLALDKALTAALQADGFSS